MVEISETGLCCGLPPSIEGTPKIVIELISLATLFVVPPPPRRNRLSARIVLTCRLNGTGFKQGTIDYSGSGRGVVHFLKIVTLSTPSSVDLLVPILELLWGFFSLPSTLRCSGVPGPDCWRLVLSTGIVTCDLPGVWTLPPGNRAPRVTDLHPPLIHTRSRADVYCHAWSDCVWGPLNIWWMTYNFSLRGILGILQLELCLDILGLSSQAAIRILGTNYQDGFTRFLVWNI